MDPALDLIKVRARPPTTDNRALDARLVAEPFHRRLRISDGSVEHQPAALLGRSDVLDATMVALQPAEVEV